MKHFNNMSYVSGYYNTYNVGGMLKINGRTMAIASYAYDNVDLQNFGTNQKYNQSRTPLTQGFLNLTSLYSVLTTGNRIVYTLSNGTTIEVEADAVFATYKNIYVYVYNNNHSLVESWFFSINEPTQTPRTVKYFGICSYYNRNTAVTYRGAQTITDYIDNNKCDIEFYRPSTELSAALDAPILTEDPYQFAPESSTGGGYGEFDYSSDDTDFSRVPTISACDAGFCTLYKLGANDVKDLADYLWGLGSLASFLPIFSDPMECILSLGIVPVSPVTGTSQNIKVGNLTTTVTGTKITKQFDTFDMGSVTINGGDFSQSFMDYSPYTKAELFLPYIGTISLDIDEIMDSTLQLKYMFDLLSGSCIAELKVSKVYNYKNADHTHKNVLYRYSGNILTNIPITGANYTQMFQAIIGAVATGIGGAAGAQSAKNAIASEAIEDKAALSQISSTTGMKPGIKRAGNLTSACGFMGAQAAEIILSLPKLAHLGKPQGKEFGFPRYAEYTLSDLRGYTRIIQVHLKSIKCTDAERGMIETALNGGVIVSGTATPTQSAATNTIKVYAYTCDKICLNKADGWSLIDTITGNWRNEKIDILAPTIKIKPTTNLTQAKILTEANYVYIADFNRYYYITGISAESGDCITLSLAVDAPMSWLAGLKTQKVVVDRQEKDWNMYLSDGYIKTYNTPYCVVKKFPTAFTAENFILAVAGGGT